MVVLGMYATFATSAIAKAPTTDSALGQKMQLSASQKFVSRYVDLENVQRLNKVLAFNGVNMGLEDILYKLAECESKFNEDKCIVDTNGKLSCGLFQFQKATISQCGGDWNDPQNQVKCAVQFIMQGRGARDWYNCWRAKGLPNIRVPKIENIKDSLSVCMAKIDKPKN